jgi:hypothetical protein
MLLWKLFVIRVVKRDVTDGYWLVFRVVVGASTFRSYAYLLK